ncbi:unnamed protein product [Rotaria sordida]|uniref:Uncharacterized protein n=1 Tax=Rotaria sordida TaxID=392033 RepID=A0A815DRT9_9BILA|nr:unnamed protein product [Rotaria sordida]CAF1362663.1 unnamed protein product [Rotaria sordida]CAF4079160.1 unnamed protein product [Rotaria sordida]CAF4123653.1 unnamed protein product [Rotaria sordida]
MISNIIDAEKLNDDVDEKTTDDEGRTEILVAVENLSSASIVQPRKKKWKKGVFNREWLKIAEYQRFLKEYKLDLSQATCIVCNQQFSIHYRGKTDIDNRMKTQKHQNNMKSFDMNQQLITNTMKPSKEKDEIAAAEGTLVYHGAKHGHSYLSQQCLINVCKTIFISSTVANSLSCARTKATSIAVNVLSPCFTQHLLDDLKNSSYFSLLYDAGNKGNAKLFPFCVQFLSVTGVKKGIIDLIDDADESAIKIFANAHQLLLDNGLDIHGLTALGADNTNVNVGDNHSVYSLFKDEIPDILKGNCYSHILHNSVKHAHRVLPIDIEQILLSIYSHFSRSAKCVNELKQYYEFYEQDFKKNLELQRYYTTAVDLFRIITFIKNKLKECIDSQFFGAACRYRLARLPIDKQNMLKTSFIEFLSKIISYENIEALTWNQVIQYVDMLKIKGLNEDYQSIPIFDQIQAFVKKQNDITVTNICDDVTDVDDDYSTRVKRVRSDQLWMLLLSLTKSPKFKKFICFLYSLPCSNAYVESAFSHMKHLLNDRRSCMTTELISAELKIRLNSTLSSTELYKYILSSEDLLRAIKSDEKHTFKRKCV